MTNSTDKLAAERQHQPMRNCSHAVASTIIQRHRNNRQRFDSADYEMARRALGPCAGCTCGKCALSNSVDLEHEPEPENTIHCDELRCLRLQRFDSADWMLLKVQQTEQPLQTDFPSRDPTNVAQMFMDRHALKRCAFVGPRPVKNGQDSVEGDPTSRLGDPMTST
ncbi:unnamed protein product [Peronospora belbahrii]|uniref:Uncharacterized protein n=1 Tax=Peronospora belbahrii TaxID=622444 RepID=A0AAU9KZ92_9STRA|nr:unnamed protein product [Peronospora belbahrii]CAH0515344.1 unnamed protein product [Peronospora belbahrii]